MEETTGFVLHNNSLYPALQAGQPEEFMARLGQFSLLNSAERAGVLAARATAELIRRHQQELAWLAELAKDEP